MRTSLKALLPVLLFLLGVLCSCGTGNTAPAPGASGEASASVETGTAEAQEEPAVSHGAETESPGMLRIQIPKIGAADASLILTEDYTVLLDTGESDDGEELLDLLKKAGRDHVDLLVISHYDKDHVGGAAEILSSVPVARVIGSTLPKDSDEVAAYYAALSAAGLTEEVPTDTLTVTLGALTVTVDPPRPAGYTEDESNNASNLVTLTWGDKRLLFCGDAMEARLQEFDWEAGAYDFIKVPHHGRDPQWVSYYLSSLKEGAAAVICCSDKTPEDADLAAALEAAGVSVYLTREGDVAIATDGSELRVTQ